MKGAHQNAIFGLFSGRLVVSFYTSNLYQICTVRALIKRPW
jgi:hypothetical protein